MTLIEAFARYVERSLSRHPMRGRVRIAVSSDEYRAIEADMRARGYAFTDGVVSGVRLVIEGGRRSEDLLVTAPDPMALMGPPLPTSAVVMQAPVVLVAPAFVEDESFGSAPTEEIQAALEEAVEDLKENAEDLFEAPAPALVVVKPRKRGRRG